MDRKQLFGLICCFVAAFIWGTAFTAQDLAAEYMQPFTFQTLRSALAVLVLTLVIAARDAVVRKRGIVPQKTASRKFLLLGGLLCGLFLAAAAGLQQMGIANNTGSPGKDAFITALYVVFFPFLALLFGRRAAPHVYAAVAVALAGLWLLCMGGDTLSLGDIQLIICAFLFACQMTLVDHVAPRVDVLRLSRVQFMTVTAISAILMAIFERPSWADVGAGWFHVFYAGVLSSAGAYTLQMVGQKNAPPVAACLVLSLESVAAVLTGLVMQHLYPAPREWIGMTVIFVAIVVAQIPGRAKKAEGEPPAS